MLGGNAPGDGHPSATKAGNNPGVNAMWDKLRATALVTALLAGTAAMAYAQSSSTLGTGGSKAGGDSSSTTLGTGGSATGGSSGSSSDSTLGTGGSSAGGGSSSTTLGTGGSAAGGGTGTGTSSTLGTGGSNAGGGSSSTTLGTGGGAAGNGKSGTSSTLGTGGSAAGSEKGTGTSSTLGTGGSTAGSKTPGSGSSTTMGTAGSAAGSSMGQQERRAHRFKHGQHRGETEATGRHTLAPGCHLGHGWRKGTSIGAQLRRPAMRQSSRLAFLPSSRTSTTPAIARTRITINPISAAVRRAASSSSRARCCLIGFRTPIGAPG